MNTALGRFLLFFDTSFLQSRMSTEKKKYIFIIILGVRKHYKGLLYRELVLN